MKLLRVTVGGFRNIRRTTLQMQDFMALTSLLQLNSALILFITGESCGNL